MFLLQKTFSLILSPFFLALVLLLAGLFLLWLTRKQIAGKVLVSVSGLIILLLSISSLSDRILKPLEYQYPPLMIEEAGVKPDIQKEFKIKWIVVLGGGHISDPHVPVTSRISSGSLIRLTEGIRLYRKLPGSKIVLMGGAVFDPVPEVETEAKIAEIMQVNRNDLVLESVSKDTEDQAKHAKTIVGSDPFILVTSASHMPRSMALFQKMGMKPIAAPTHYRVSERQNWSPQDYFPSSVGIGKAENAVYEYLCLYWSKIRNKL
jgi:uncharacterized SAM-binding protein YcdF (DUF218 family)